MFDVEFQYGLGPGDAELAPLSEDGLLGGHRKWPHAGLPVHVNVQIISPHPDRRRARRRCQQRAQFLQWRRRSCVASSWTPRRIVTTAADIGSAVEVRLREGGRHQLAVGPAMPMDLVLFAEKRLTRRT